jgi:hypothetical protein
LSGGVTRWRFILCVRASAVWWSNRGQCAAVGAGRATGALALSATRSSCVLHSVCSWCVVHWRSCMVLCFVVACSGPQVGRGTAAFAATTFLRRGGQTWQQRCVGWGVLVQLAWTSLQQVAQTADSCGAHTDALLPRACPCTCDSTCVAMIQPQCWALF